ncbi:PREDICTED: replication factor A 51 kDa subunit-like [Erythranthe guttata]|uniref:replication factor A 51 kDa subunit-like n=1 Tax=Erythranthe guttata TaxID=4155 RepID=UPI00064DAEAD|nr:PREDICTED: replication factor A 51 kDa subunit-like [Erythranthe guttata]|eukprot:XP_012845764.1 PREDICTED: replication factor A 51 kDa subunit-like [Erythranthe guttata]
MALTSLNFEYINKLTYSPSMAPCSAYPSSFENAGSLQRRCREALYRIGELPHLVVAFNSLEGMMTLLSSADPSKSLVACADRLGNISRVISGINNHTTGIKLNCTLWDTFAEDIDVFFANHNHGEPVIIILQYCRIKTYNGKNNITNSYYGITMTINPKLKECEDYKEKLAMRDASFTQSVSHISSQRSITISADLLQTNRMTIADVVESTTVANGALLAKVVEIESQDKWWYESCVTCFKKVETSGTTFYCPNCRTTVMVVPRFRVQVKVIDDTGSASFVMFDRVIAQLLGRSASDIITDLRKALHFRKFCWIALAEY